MARKRKGKTRKQPLMFSESPVEVSRQFPTPVFAVANPVRAALVPVGDRWQTWVSPQIDLNAPWTPRKGRSRKCKTACRQDQRHTQQRCDQRHAQQRCDQMNNQETMETHYKSLKFLRKEIQTSYEPNTTEERISTSNRRNSLDEFSLSTSNDTMHELTHYESSPINQVHSVQKSAENALPDSNSGKSTRTLRKRLTSNAGLNIEGQSGVTGCSSLHSIHHRGFSMMANELNGTRLAPHENATTTRWCYNKSPRIAKVLAYDTPESDYGMKVSLRRRRLLLPAAARIKLGI